MKRIVSLISATLLLLLGSLSLAAFAAAAETETFVCQEEGFTVQIPAGLTAVYTDDSGLQIFTENPGYVPYVLVSRRPLEMKLNNPENYLNNVYREYMENQYGDNMIGTNPCKTYEVGGKSLFGARYMYKVQDTTLCLFRFVEVREDGDVEYSAKYIDGEGDETLEALEIVIASYTTGEAAGKAEEPPVPEVKPEAPVEEALEDVACAEQGYTTRMPAGLSTTWQEGNGLRVWVEEPGYVPNVLIWRRPQKLNDPENYVKNVYTDHMKNTYGDDLIGVSNYEYFETGGKKLLATAYIYRASSGASINQIHLVEIRDDGDVEYDARFLNDQREETLKALDIAVRYYQPDNAPAPQPQTAEKKEEAPAPQPQASLISDIRPYSDGRFSMDVPAGWQLMTESDYTTFCFKAWDPASPDRTYFLFMKLEPFLKSWGAKQKYIDLNNSLGGNSLYQLFASAPVMESCTLDAFLGTIPAIRDFCDKFYAQGMTLNPAVIPEMTNVKIVEKTASTIMAAPTCRDNSIARVTYQNYQGQLCEAIVTAQPLDMLSYIFEGVDGGSYSVYMFMGVTSPLGELDSLADPLTGCLNTFAFEENYVRQAVMLSEQEKQALLEQAKAAQAAHDAMARAWNPLN